MEKSISSPLLAVLAHSHETPSDAVFFVGTGILVQIGPHVAVITARHVAEVASDHDVYLHLGPASFALRSQPIVCPNEDHSRRFFSTVENDKADIALILLDEKQTASVLSFHVPIPIEKFRSEMASDESRTIILGGYPEDINKVVSLAAPLDKHLLSYTSGPPINAAKIWPMIYSEEGHDCYLYSETRNVGIRAEPTQAPAAFGMSGGLAIAVDHSTLSFVSAKRGLDFSIEDFYQALTSNTQGVFVVGVVIAWIAPTEIIVAVKASKIAQWVDFIFGE
jgi:hypothetical protein